MDNMIQLTDETGTDVSFEFLDMEHYDGKNYVILLPVDDDDGEVVILCMEENDTDDMENYVSIEDSEVLEHVFMMFKEKFKDEFDFQE